MRRRRTLVAAGTTAGLALALAGCGAAGSGTTATTNQTGIDQQGQAGVTSTGQQPATTSSGS